MLSRVADSLYWMSRYLERAEHIARVVNVNLNLTLDRAPADAARHWGRLLGSLPAPPAYWVRTAAEPLEDDSVDLANRESIVACVGAARENASQVREEISSEMWEELNRLYLAVQETRPQSSDWTSGAHEFLTATIGGVHLFQGVTDATMTHGEGWHFMELGRHLERTIATAALLEVQYRECEWTTDQAAGVSEYVEWVGLLKSCCAFEAYCRHYTADVRPTRIAEFLVLNPNFPRSIHFAARSIHSSLRVLSGLTRRADGAADRLSGRLLASLEFAEMDEVIPDLTNYLQGIVGQAGHIHSAINQQYIAYPIESVLTT